MSQQKKGRTAGSIIASILLSLLLILPMTLGVVLWEMRGTVSEKGIGKLTALKEFAVHHRGTKGMLCYRIAERTGNVIGNMELPDASKMLVTYRFTDIYNQTYWTPVVGR